MLSIYIFFLFIHTVHGDYIGRLCRVNWNNTAVHFFDNTLTIDLCIEYCKDFPYAGLFIGFQCYCGYLSKDELICNSHNEDSNDCQTRCPISTGQYCAGDNSTICGGNKDWYSIYETGENATLIRDCGTTAAQMCSAQDESCTIRCDVTNIGDCYQQDRVHGTDQYESGSSICLAAQHDFRSHSLISEVELTIKRITHNLAQLEGSWRYGIDSDWINATSSFTFLNNKVDTTDKQVYAILSLNERKVTCLASAVPPGSQLVLVKVEKNQILSSTSDPKLENQVDQNSLVYCGLQNAPDSFVPIVWPSDYNYMNLTTTAALNSRVELNFTITGSLSFQLKKNSETLATLNSMVTRYAIPNILSSSTGFYQLWNGSLVSYTRLIIDNNEKDNYCQNGGRLNPSTLACMCLPPFGGFNCTATCDLGKFGYNCEIPCSSQSGQNCQGQVICGPDPLGCHCASGWTGPKCEDSCKDDTYGPGCMFQRICHCKNGEGCNRFFGNCTQGGCEDGFFGSNCDKEDPYLKSTPRLVAAHYNSITIQWDAWNRSDGGSDERGPPSEYVMQYIFDDNVSTVRISCISEICEGSTDTSLKVNTSVTFSIFTVNHNVQSPHSSGNLTVITVCETPTTYPSNIEVKFENSTEKAIVSWNLVTMDDLKCDVGNVIVSMTCKSCEGSFNNTYQVDYQINSTEVDTVPASKCDFDIYLSNGQTTGDGPKWTVTNETKESAPGEITSLQLFGLPNGNLFVLWKKPENPNGKIRHYRVTIKMKSSTKGTAEKDVEVIDTFVELPSSDFDNGSDYIIEVTASNDAGDSQPVSSEYKKPKDGNSSLSPYWIAIICLLILIAILLFIGVFLFVKWYKAKKQLQEKPANTRLDSTASYGGAYTHQMTTPPATDYSQLRIPARESGYQSDSGNRF